MFPNILKLEQKSELLLFHKAVSVHGPSCLSSVMAAREEDRYRISRTIWNISQRYRISKLVLI